jgi:hypothetical protein
MDYQRKQRRIGVLSVVLSLLLVVAWRLYSPTVLQAYKYHRDEARLKQEFQAIHLPPETENVNVQVIHVKSHTFLLSAYHEQSDAESIKTYYMQEFARLGFTYHGEQKGTLQFCTTEYRVDVNVATLERGEHSYFISLSGNDAPC